MSVRGWIDALLLKVKPIDKNIVSRGGLIIKTKGNFHLSCLFKLKKKKSNCLKSVKY